MLRLEDHWRDDAVTIKDASCFVAGDGHGDALADASSHHVPHCRSPHVVEDQANIFQIANFQSSPQVAQCFSVSTD